MSLHQTGEHNNRSISSLTGMHERLVSNLILRGPRGLTKDQR